MKIEQFLSQSPDYQIHLAGKRAAFSLNATLAEFDVNLTQALLLVALYFEVDHCAAFEDLSEAFELTKGGLSQHLSQMEEKKLIRRQPQDNDKRSSRILLRSEAHELCQKLIKVFDGHQRKLENTVGELEIKKFLTTLRQIRF